VGNHRGNAAPGQLHQSAFGGVHAAAARNQSRWSLDQDAGGPPACGVVPDAMVPCTGELAGTDLKTVASRLKEQMRDSDCFARLGGDEFAILLSGRIDAADEELLCKRIAKSFAEPGR
jgi:Diguanylate cyclase, GGDEF domain